MPTSRPLPTEYAPHQEKYISLVAQGPVLDVLRSQLGDVSAKLASIDESRGGERYQPGKWTVREVVGHMSDAERVYNFRALAFARGDALKMPPYDPDGYVASAGFDSRTMRELIDEFAIVRQATLALFGGLPVEAWSRGGEINGKPLSVRALAYIAAGHVEQHMKVLRERYGLPV